MQYGVTQHRHDFPPKSVLHTTGGRPWTMYRTPLPETPDSIPAPGTGDARDGGTASNRVNEAGNGKRQGKGLPLTVVSYNVLADSLVSLDYIPYCQTWDDAAWKVRPSRILAKVMEFEPDVLCLQEVDEGLYRDFFLKQLEVLGYTGAYCPRGGDKVDGCATFVRGHRFHLLRQEDVVYRIQGHPVLDRDNIALLVVVDVFFPEDSADEDISSGSSSSGGGGGGSGGGGGKHLTEPPEGGEKKAQQAEECNRGDGRDSRAARTAAPVPSTPAASKPSPLSGDAEKAAPVRASARLVIANTHLLFNPKRGDIKMAQLMMLTERVEMLSRRSEADGVIICGDFNMTPDSACYHYMIKGELHVDGMNRFTASGQCGNDHSSPGQRKETDTCGASSRRVASSKHQGGGCTLGSFLRPFVAPTMHSRDRQGRWGGSAARRPPCHLCSGRAPHGASSSYLTVGASTAEGDTPSGAPAGSIFAVMDPSPCPCTIERAGKAGQEGGRDRNGGTGSSRGGGGGGGGEGMYHPRLLWPVGGSKFAYSAGHGPVEHPLKLRSAYSQQADAWGTGEPAFTSYHHMFKIRPTTNVLQRASNVAKSAAEHNNQFEQESTAKFRMKEDSKAQINSTLKHATTGTVDYIFYGPGPLLETSNNTDGGRSSPDSPTLGEAVSRLAVAKRSGLRCVGVSEPPLRPDLDHFGGLPSPEEPSDHVLLAVRFEIVPPQP